MYMASECSYYLIRQGCVGMNLYRVHVATVNTLSLKGHLGANNYVNCCLIEEGSFFQTLELQAA